MSSDSISSGCSKCGSSNFIYPNNPPKDDDIIVCAGCKREVGRFNAVRAAAVKAAKVKGEKIIMKTLRSKHHRLPG